MWSAAAERQRDGGCEEPNEDWIGTSSPTPSSDRLLPMPGPVLVGRGVNGALGPGEEPGVGVGGFSLRTLAPNGKGSRGLGTSSWETSQWLSRRCDPRRLVPGVQSLSSLQTDGRIKESFSQTRVLVHY